jgi:ketosteroid isomerase-like protein
MRKPIWVGWIAAGLGLTAFTSGLSGCMDSPPKRLPTLQQSSEEDRSAVLHAHKSLLSALRAADVEALVSVLDSSPDLRIFHPNLGLRITGIDQARGGFGKMFDRLGSAEWTEVHTELISRGDVAWHTSRLVVESPNSPSPFLGQGIEIWIRRGSDWKLIHGQWSGGEE